MSLFNFSPEEAITFFAILVRFSVIFALLPIFGDKVVPLPAKVLFSVAVTMALYPGLTKMGWVKVSDAAIWGATNSGIIMTIGSEVLIGLVLGFTAKLVFDAINIGASIMGTHMGFAMASTYDNHQESNTLVVSEIQLAIATLAFLAFDGHHLMLRAALESYQFCGMGQAAITELAAQRLIDITSQVLVFALQLSAPIAVILFAVNVAFGVFSKAMPQMNILVLSLSISAFVGLLVMYLSAPEFQAVAVNVMGHSEDWMNGMLTAMASK
jgi:flagellar biosynthetic protein FliR